MKKVKKKMDGPMEALNKKTKNTSSDESIPVGAVVGVVIIVLLLLVSVGVLVYRGADSIDFFKVDLISDI